MKFLASTLFALLLVSFAAGCVVHTKGGSSYKAKAK